MSERMKLLPCPFCGGPARVFQKYRDPKPLNWRVCCDNETPARGHQCSMDVCSDFESEAEAIAAWNRRHIPPEAVEAARRIKRERYVGSKFVSDARAIADALLSLSGDGE